MGQEAVLKARGLHLSANPFSAVPQGGLVKADNCVVPFRDVLESRRGQVRLGYGFGVDADRSNEGYFWQDTLFLHYGTTLVRDTGSAFTALSGSYSGADEATLRMKFAELARRLFVATSGGLYVLDSVTATPAAAGMPQPLDFQLIDLVAFPDSGTHLKGNPGDGWLAKNSAVAYRAVFGLKDATGAIKLSAPSGRHVISNPADVVVAIASLVRAGTTVTATVASHGFRVGDVVALSPGEANFAAGNKTVTTVSPTTFTYTEAGAAIASAAEQTFSSGAKNVQLDVMLRSGLPSGSFVQVYRTEAIAGAGEDPGDECYLCHEHQFTAAELVGASYVFVDKTPEAFVGGPLYVNENSGDGALAANHRPPIAQDIHAFDGRLWAAETTDRHRMALRLIGCGSPDGIQTTDFVAVDGVVIPGTAFATTDYSPAKNIELTVAKFISAYNSESGIPAYAFGVTDGDSPVGQILFEEASIGGSAFYAGTTRTTAFQEPIAALLAVTEASTSRTGSTVTVTTASSHGFAAGQQVYLAAQTADANFPRGLKTVATTPTGTTFTYSEAGAAATMTGTYFVYAASFYSDNNRKPLRFSKQGEPESWPLVNYPAGLPENLEVLRIHEHRGKLFVFFKSGDIYTVSGRYPYYVERFDGTATLLAADTLKEHSNRLFGLTTQGVVAISDGGVQIVSAEIEPELLELFGGAMTEVARYAFAVSYESDRQYQLWLPSAEGDTTCEQAFVYNSLLGLWTRWTGPRTWGQVRRSTNKLYLGDGEDNTVRVERKSYDRTDYADGELSVTLSAASGTLVTLSSVVGVAVGDLLYQSDSQKALITEVDAVNSQVTVLSTESWTTGAAATIYLAIDCAAKWAPAFGGAPGFEKQWRDAVLHFNRFYVHAFSALFDCEKNVTERTVPMAQEGFGLTVFGGGVFGQEVGAQNKRADVPNDYARSAQLRVGFSIREAWALWSSNGFTLNFEPTSERTGA